MTAVGDAVAQALATLAGIDVTTAGYALGGTLVIILFAVFVLALGDYIEGQMILLPGVFGIILAILIGWWPPWTAAFIVIVLLFMALHPYSGGASA